MAEFPVLPLWADAYLADTKHLTPLEHGVYLLLLMCAWRHPDCSLPDDDKLLARMVGLHKGTWRRHRDVIMDFWELGSDGRWRQKRLSKEREKVTNLRATNREKGIIGARVARAKSLKNKDTRSAVAPPCRVAEGQPAGTDPQGELSISISNYKNPECVSPESSAAREDDSLITHTHDSMEEGGEKKPPTDSQMTYIRSLCRQRDIDVPNVETAADAAELIDDLKAGKKPGASAPSEVTRERAAKQLTGLGRCTRCSQMVRERSSGGLCTVCAGWEKGR